MQKKVRAFVSRAVAQSQLETPDRMTGKSTVLLYRRKTPTSADGSRRGSSVTGTGIGFVARADRDEHDPRAESGVRLPEEIQEFEETKKGEP
jgi:hypothetical protein